MCFFLRIDSCDLEIFAIFDGHGGNGVADKVVELLPKTVEKVVKEYLRDENFEESNKNGEGSTKTNTDSFNFFETTSALQSLQLSPLAEWVWWAGSFA